ncbi:MAG TPA: sugar phosphate nucleotidyltransferase [Methanothrix sp.]|jgi:bifunctional UDP-N-acetylglucosamine pyrophosphorylase/glucosamine-1-phosphate N-acetyltransferase|nr:MAG: Bifunctional protein GlmU [Methanosaeta sp. PtaU1.Bin055]HNR56938.1 sugar phosphate nucleotidyltransferase [Methanothrix sp.]HNT72665.1 sugar phosphate nucleotidyltransferase [Methanothrix sp.]HOI69437.1 sugar phosphate nucleotidyltransferase [Methanothrix sp.]
MQAIVLAAGEGSRMRPLTLSRPKVMVPIGGRPFLDHVVDRAMEAGVIRFVFVVGYRSEVIIDHFGDGNEFGADIEYVVQSEQLGTGHALMMAEDMATDRFLVLNGDVLADLPSLKRFLEIKGDAVAAKRVADPSRYGVFEVDGDRLRSVVEKSRSPPSDLANAGIYLFRKTIFEALRGVNKSVRGEVELTDGINVLVSRGEEVRVVEIEDWIEVGRPWDVLEANKILLSEIDRRIEGNVEPGATLSGNVIIGEGSRVRSGSYIVGPVVIGKDCDIGPNCFIRAHTCIGDRVRIGNAVEIKNSAIMDNTNVAHLSYVGDSVIGSKCNFGAGTIVANLRHDDANIKSFIKGEKVDSGRRKLGAIVGDDVKTGINSSVYPGTVIEPGYRGRPSEVIRGHIEARSRHGR